MPSIESFSGYNKPDKRENLSKGNRAWTFAGQGTQAVGMGEKLATVNKFAKKTYKQADEILGFSMSGVSFKGPEEVLNQTINAQPAIFTFNYICEQLLKQTGHVSPNKKIAAGHSLGEYNAAVSAGAIAFEDALWLVGERGKAMSKACIDNPGGMIAVALRETDEKLTKLMEKSGLEKSIINGHEQIVLAGSRDGLKEAVKWSNENGVKWTPLVVEGAFHSSLMAPAVDDFDRALNQVHIKQAKIPILANTTATLIRNPDEIRRELRNQLTHPVLWKDSLIFMTRNGIAETFEIGEKGILSNMNMKVNGGKYEKVKKFIKGAVINFVIWRQNPQSTAQLA